MSQPESHRRARAASVVAEAALSQREAADYCSRSNRFCRPASDVEKVQVTGATARPPFRAASRHARPYPCHRHLPSSIRPPPVPAIRALLFLVHRHSPPALPKARTHARLQHRRKKAAVEKEEAARVNRAAEGLRSTATCCRGRPNGNQ
ncbi:hypothetical protein AAHC03_05327 [Spirometra sp. Aus1]